MTKIYFSRVSLVALIVSTYLIALLSAFLSPKVKASQTWEWTRITDNTFTSNNNTVDQSTVDLENNILYFHGENRNLYKYDGETTTSIGDGIPLDESYGFTSMVFWNGNLYAAFTNFETPKLFSYDGTEWSESSIPLPRVGTISIVHLASISGLLVAWSLTDSGRFIDLYGGSSWTDITNLDSFGDWDLFSSELVDITDSSTALFILLSHPSDNKSSVWKFEWGGDSWVQLGNTFDEIYNDLQSYNGDLLMSSATSPARLLIWSDSLWALLGESDGFGDINNSQVKLVMYTSQLYALVSNQSGNASLYKYSNSVDWTLISSFIGEDNESAPNSWVTSAVGFNDKLFVAASKIGEGPYEAIGWLINPADLNDFDGDGIPNSVEDAASENGDLFFDEIPDKYESEFTAFTNPITGNIMALYTDCLGFNGVSVTSEESVSTHDKAFDYPAGLINFNMECNNGSGMVMFVIFGDYDPELNVIRKYNENTGTYTTMTDVNILGGDEEHSIYMLAYDVEDGGEYDADGVVNGVIVDPIGFAVNAVSVPDTSVAGINRYYFTKNEIQR